MRIVETLKECGRKLLEATAPASGVPAETPFDRAAETVEGRLLAMASRHLAFAPGAATPDSFLLEAGADGFAVLGFFMRVEEAFGVEIGDVEAELALKVGDVVRMVERKLAAARP